MVVPLKPDALTPIVYSAVNTSMFTRFAGQFDQNGVAKPAFVVPAKAIPWYFAGTKIYFAAVGVDRQDGQDRVRRRVAAAGDREEEEAESEEVSHISVRDHPWGREAVVCGTAAPAARPGDDGTEV